MHHGAQHAGRRLIFSRKLDHEVGSDRQAVGTGETAAAGGDVAHLDGTLRFGNRNADPINQRPRVVLNAHRATILMNGVDLASFGIGDDDLSEGFSRQH